MIILIRVKQAGKATESAGRTLSVAPGIRVLRRHTDDVTSVPGERVENQVHAFGKAIVAGLYIRPLSAAPRVLRQPGKTRQQ